MRILVIRLAVLLITATLSACNLTAASPTAGPTPDLPQVEFIAPVNGATIFEGTLLDIDIVARDTTAGVNRIEFYVDGEMLENGSPDSGSESVFRVTMNWLAEGVGLHSLMVIAYRPDGTPSPDTTLVVEVVARQ